MKLLLLSAAIVAALVAGANAIKPAHAQGWLITRSCVGGNCSMSIGRGVGGLGKVLKIEPPMSDAEIKESARRESVWVQFCNPTPVRDRYGVLRNVYAHEGCEFGRSE